MVVAVPLISSYANQIASSLGFTMKIILKKHKLNNFLLRFMMNLANKLLIIVNLMAIKVHIHSMMDIITIILQAKKVIINFHFQTFRQAINFHFQTFHQQAIISFHFRTFRQVIINFSLNQTLHQYLVTTMATIIRAIVLLQVLALDFS